MEGPKIEGSKLKNFADLKILSLVARRERTIAELFRDEAKEGVIRIDSFSLARRLFGNPSQQIGNAATNYHLPSGEIRVDGNGHYDGSIAVTDQPCGGYFVWYVNGKLT